MKTLSKPLLQSSLLVGITTFTFSSALYIYIQFKRKRRTAATSSITTTTTSNDEKDNNEEIEKTLERLKPNFEKACLITKSSPIFKSLPTNDQLMLYGLYKQAQFGDANNSRKPSILLDMVSSAKYNAWMKFHDMPRDFAMLKYIEVVHHFEKNGGKEDGGHGDGDDDGDGGDSERIISTQNNNIAKASFFSSEGADDNADIIYDDEDDDDDDDILSDEEEEEEETQKKEKSSSLPPSMFSFGAQQSTLIQDTLSSTSINCENINDDNDLKQALLHGSMIGNIDIIQQCLQDNNEKVALVNYKDEDGQTALHLASDKGYLNIVNLLLENGANPNAQDESGISPLAVAVISGNIDIVKLLLDAGGDPDLKDADGETPRSCAEEEDDGDGSDMKALLRSALPLIQR